MNKCWYKSAKTCLHPERQRGATGSNHVMGNLWQTQTRPEHDCIWRTVQSQTLMFCPNTHRYLRFWGTTDRGMVFSWRFLVALNALHHHNHSRSAKPPCLRRCLLLEDQWSFSPLSTSNMDVSSKVFPLWVNPHTIPDHCWSMLMIWICQSGPIKVSISVPQCAFQLFFDVFLVFTGKYGFLPQSQLYTYDSYDMYTSIIDTSSSQTYQTTLLANY